MPRLAHCAAEQEGDGVAAQPGSSRAESRSRGRAKQSSRGSVAPPRRIFGVPLERSTPQRLPAHAEAPRTQSWRRWALGQRKPRAIDLFAGCGGLSLGLERAGYSVVLSVDTDPWCLETHRHNLPGPALDLDLAEPDRMDALLCLLNGIPIELVAGGPPCQPFSRAGRAKLRSLVEEGVRSAQDERTDLWRAFLEVVERVRPPAVLLENVPDMALGDDLLLLRAMTARLEAAGYDVEARLLDAWRHGVPQHRQRLILVATRDGRPFAWPVGQKRLTLRDAIGDLPSLGNGTGELEMKARRPRTAFQRRARERMNGRGILWDHVTRRVRDDDREAFHLMKPGTRYGDLPKRLRRYRDDIFDDKYNRLSWGDLSRSITAHIAKDGYWYIHPSEHRTLTVREAARIQTFPDDFRFAGTRSHAFRQIGNAVPPALGEAVGRALLRAARRKALPESRRPARGLSAMRSRLIEWGAKDARLAPWRHPGDPWAVLAGVVLGDRVGGQDEAVRDFLVSFPRVQPGTGARIRKGASARSGTQRADYERMAAVACALAGGRRAWDRDAWVGAGRLGPAEEALVRTIGLGEERILATHAMLRVAARFAGTRVNEERRLSDGRMEIARIVGAGENAASTTAALHALGRVVCTPADPGCRRCPLTSCCASSNGMRLKQ